MSLHKQNNKKNDNYVIIGVDGTCSNEYNNSELITNNTIYLFELNKRIPISFINTTKEHFQNNKNNKSNKNREVTTLINYLHTNSKELIEILLSNLLQKPISESSFRHFKNHRLKMFERVGKN